MALLCTRSYPARHLSILTGALRHCLGLLTLPANPYLSEGALEGAEFIEAPGRNADHGGQSQEPAQGIAPPWVRVLLVVGQGSVLDQGEEESGLRRRVEEKGAGRAGPGALHAPWKS